MIKGKRRWFSIMCMIYLACMTACGTTVTFDGSKAGNDELFYMDFSVLNTSYDAVMPVQDGDVLHCTFEVKKGTIDVEVTCNEDRVYRGNAVESGEFDLNIKTAGECKIVVTGKNAAGKLYFEKKD